MKINVYLQNYQNYIRRIILIRMLEKEIKILLSVKEYNELFNIFEFEKPFIQTNYYYGNREDVIDDVTIRIRQKNDILRLQVKIPQYINGSIHIKEEYEEEIDAVYDVIDKKILKKVTERNFENDLPLIGKLVTKRAICKKYKGVEIALDKNEYLDVTDYELEIEYENEYPQYILDMLKEYNIKIHSNTSGKNKRFRKRLNNRLVSNEDGEKTFNRNLSV
ncbi:CYTH domain-containing protein [Eubacterium sp.]|uniref:CYTH domain-containing protein n=1 Tax=Eubacterium sp. TaxID=142586 RepID=UPI001DD8A3A7|nr:CYTH domain-containing protein [Eubacterium sp.]MBS5620732.1 CYTH domain-containing protein [Eubacterium sp.]